MDCTQVPRLVLLLSLLFVALVGGSSQRRIYGMIRVTGDVFVGVFGFRVFPSASSTATSTGGATREYIVQSTSNSMIELSFKIYSVSIKTFVKIANTIIDAKAQLFIVG